MVTTMNAEIPTTPFTMQNVPADFRRLFFAHVGALVLTAALVVPLMLGFASIPAWVSVAYCVVIAIVALAFVAASITVMSRNRGSQMYITMTLALSVTQLIFVLPILICVFAPTFRA